VLGSISFTNGWATEMNVLHSDDNLLIENVEFDDSTIIVLDWFVGSDADVTDDSLHPA
jgi:hypothetical protein